MQHWPETAVQHIASLQVVLVLQAWDCCITIAAPPSPSPPSPSPPSPSAAAGPARKEDPPVSVAKASKAPPPITPNSRTAVHGMWIV